MSKLTKLINNPKLFALDFAKKRVNLLDSALKLDSTQKQPIKKRVAQAVKSEPEVSVRSTISGMKSPIIFHCGEEVVAGLGMCGAWFKLTGQYQTQALFVIRTLSLYKKLLEQFPDRNIIFAKTPIEIESLINEYNVQTICYMSNTANNIHCIRFNHIRHIFMGGFDKERQVSSHKYFRAYDECWVYSTEKFNELKQSVDLRHLELIELNNPVKYLSNKSTSNVTYVATNANTEYNSYHLIKDICNNAGKLDSNFIAYVADKIQGINKFLNSLGVFYSSESIVLDFTEIAITDLVENTVLNLLELNIPTIVYLPDNIAPSFSFEDTSILDVCYTYKNITELNNLLISILSGNDELKLAREKFIKYKFGIDYIQNDIFKSKFDELFKGLI